jgi:hypothetical protein
MKFYTGIHPRHWHRGAWLLAFLIAAMATAQPASDASAGTAPQPTSDGWISEVVNSSYTVGPAEFFALDLPTNKPDAKAVHLSGTVTTQGRGKDIIVRLFRGADYDRWLKQKSGRKPQALWTSPRSRSLTLDRDLPPGEAMVLLLDNGYSVRTPKLVTCQLQIRYSRNPTDTFDTEGSSAPATTHTGTSGDTTPDNLPTPRSNTDEEMPAPPPPPPSGY